MLSIENTYQTIVDKRWDNKNYCSFTLSQSEQSIADFHQFCEHSKIAMMSRTIPSTRSGVMRIELTELLRLNAGVGLLKREGLGKQDPPKLIGNWADTNLVLPWESSKELRSNSDAKRVPPCFWRVLMMSMRVVGGLKGVSIQRNAKLLRSPSKQEAISVQRKLSQDENDLTLRQWINNEQQNCYVDKTLYSDEQSFHRFWWIVGLMEQATRI